MSKRGMAPGAIDVLSIALGEEPQSETSRPTNEAKARTTSTRREPETRGLARLSADINSELLEAVKDAAYWTRTPLAHIIAESLRKELARLQRENGGLFERRPGAALRPGRPIR